MCALHAKFVIRELVSIYAHDGPTKAMRLSYDVTSNGTVEQFLKYFRDQGYISKTGWDKRELEIRLGCSEAELVSVGSKMILLPSGN